MTGNAKRGIVFALAAAALYAINSPMSKLLLGYLPPTFMAGFLYLGAGVGMGVIMLVRKLGKRESAETRLTRRELPYTVAMILLDIAAPICLMIGLSGISASGASLLNNFEIVATAVIASVVFREKISLRLALAISFITLSCAILSVENLAEVRLSWGALFVLAAAVLWGFENNCTRKLSDKDPTQIVLLKGIFSGLGSCMIALAAGERVERLWCALAAMGVGVVAYGLSIFAYIYAQRYIGAARTSAYYAIAPFIGAALSLVIFREIPAVSYYVALAVMAVGAWLAASDRPLFGRKPGNAPQPPEAEDA